MKNKLISAAVAGITVFGLGAGSAFAWTYGLSGSGACQTDGSYKITWTINNTTESQDLTVKTSSNTAVVPVGTTVAEHQTADFTESESGTTAPATYTLTLDVTWPGDMNDHNQTASVTLATACTQPTPPVTPPTTPPTTGGRGGGTPVTTAASTTTTPQVQAPTGGVGAGEGGASTATSAAALFGLTGSLLATGYGLRRYNKQN